MPSQTPYRIAMTAQEFEALLAQIPSKIDSSIIRTTLANADQTTIPTTKAVQDALDVISGDFSSLGNLAFTDDVDLSSTQVKGVTPIAKGGTGANSAAGARANLGILTQTEIETLIAEAVPTIQEVDLSSSQAVGVLPISKGGTGAQNATVARGNLGVLSSSETRSLLLTQSVILTDAGRVKINAATVSAPVVITRIGVSDALGTITSSRTSLQNEVWRGDVNPDSKEVTNIDEAKIFSGNIPTTATSFVVREVAYFDQDGLMIALGQTQPIEKPSTSLLGFKSFLVLDSVLQASKVITKATVGSLDDLQGFTDALFSETGIVPSGQPDKLGDSQRVDAITRLAAQSVEIPFDTVALLKSGTSRNGQVMLSELVGKRVRVDGYYTRSDGGSNWGIVKSGSHLDDGGSVFSLGANLYAEMNIKGSRINILKFGAKGDFNPQTGSGTVNLTFIQNAINYVQNNGGGQVYAPHGKYYLGAGYKAGENPNLAINLLVGSITSQGLPFVNGVHLKGVGANLYAGNTGRMVHFARAKNCSISGFAFYHYTGGANGLVKALSSNCIRVSDSCEDIDIYRNYLTNYLAWGIDILSDAEDPTSSNYMSKNIKIYRNTIKTRYGDGKWMASGWQDGTNDGTGGGWVIAVINGEDISIKNNVFYGKIDLENNETGQTFYNIDIANNSFRSGWVTPQEVLPSPSGQHWHDEPTNPRGLLGAKEIRQGIYHVGVGLNNRSTNVVARDNTFEKGHILFWQNYALRVMNNHFRQGRMEIGYIKDGTEQITLAPMVVGNTAEQRHSDFPVGGFIGLMGLVPDAQIQYNSIEDSGGYGVITEEQAVGNAVSDASGNFDGNYSKLDFELVAGTYRLFVTPLLTPVVEVDISAFLYGGLGFATKKIYGGGWKNGTDVNSGYVTATSVTQGTSVTIGDQVEESATGNFYVEIAVASGAGRLNVATAKGYANANIVKIA